jgi:hypothetical protein
MLQFEWTITLGQFSLTAAASVVAGVGIAIYRRMSTIERMMEEHKIMWNHFVDDKEMPAEMKYHTVAGGR